MGDGKDAPPYGLLHTNNKQSAVIGTALCFYFLRRSGFTGRGPRLATLGRLRGGVVTNGAAVCVS